MADYRIAPAGEHKARALSAALSTTKTGKQYIHVIFQLISGGQIDWAGWFGDDNQKNTYSIEALRRCGWQGNDLTNMSSIDRNVVTLVIEDEEAGDHQRSRIKFVNRSGDAIIHRNAMPPLEANALAARLSPLCAQVTGAFKPRATQPPAPVAGRAQHRSTYTPHKGPPSHVMNDPFAGDDIPF